VTQTRSEIEHKANHNAYSLAFPVPENGFDGMTLREYIAAHALHGLIAGRVYDDAGGAESAAIEAVLYADALILALTKTPFGQSSPIPQSAPSGDI
jgi:hypothetical protein